MRHVPSTGRMMEDDLGVSSSATASEAFFSWLRREASADSIDLMLFSGSDRELYRNACVPGCFERCLYVPIEEKKAILAEKSLSGLVDLLPKLGSWAQGCSLEEAFREIEVPLPAAKVMRDLGLSDGTRITESSWDRLFGFLFAYRWEIFKVCRQKRRDLFQYFLDAGITDGMRVGIAALSWSAEATTALGRMLDAMFAVDVYGYCLYLRDDADGIAMRSTLRTRAMISADNHSALAVERIHAQRATMKTGLLRPDPGSHIE
jgi:hypothetical protein